MGLTTITQDVTDFLKSKYGKPIMTNSSIQLLLKQSPTAMDLIQKTFDLTDQEKFMLLQSSVGEGILFAGNKHVAVQIVASFTEDQIITSDPAQLLEIEQAKQDLAEEEEKKEQEKKMTQRKKEAEIAMEMAVEENTRGQAKEKKEIKQEVEKDKVEEKKEDKKQENNA
jgi:hypothetical protein